MLNDFGIPAYFLSVMVAAPIFCGMLLFAGPERVKVLAAGFLTAPWAAAGPLVVDYFPARRLGGWPIGIEDLVYSFMLGAGAWFFATLPERGRLRYDFTTRKVSPRAGVTIAAAAGAIAGGLLLGMSVWAAFVGMAVVVLATLLLIDRNLLRFAWRASLGCAAIWISLLLTAFAFWPVFTNDWNHDSPWAHSILGVPIGEVVWAVVAPAALAVSFAYCARVTSLASETEGGPPLGF